MVRWLIGSVVVLLASSALVWFMTARPSGVSSASDIPSFLGIAASRVDSIEVRLAKPAGGAGEAGSRSAALSADGSSGGGARVFRSGLTGGMPGWLIRDIPADGSVTGSGDPIEGARSEADLARATWPADDARVRAAIRVLQSTELVDPRPSDRADQRVPLATLEVSLSGDQVVVEFLDRPLLGRAPVRVTLADGMVVAASVESSVYDAFVETGVRAWGVPFLLMPAASGPSRIKVSSDLDRGDPEQGEQRLELVRRATKWRLAAPFAAPADAQAVAGLMSVLGRARVEAQALTDPELLDAQFESRPIATISVEAERPGTGDRWTQVIELGEPADLGAQSLLVRVRSSVGSREIWGPRVLRLPAETFASVTAEADRYVSPTPSDLDLAGVGGVRLLAPPSMVGDDPAESLPGFGRAHEYRLIGSTWYVMRGDARKPAPEGDAAAAAGLVRALTEGVATEVAMVPAPELAARGMLLDTLHQPSQVFRLWVDPTTSVIYASAGQLRWALTPTSDTDLVHAGWLEGLLTSMTVEAESEEPATERAPAEPDPDAAGGGP